MEATPGPWQLWKHGRIGAHFRLDMPDGGYNADIAVVELRVKGGPANARLIAAAPELLRILEHIAARLNLEEKENPGGIYILAARREEINQTIAKAREGL